MPGSADLRSKKTSVSSDVTSESPSHGLTVWEAFCHECRLPAAEQTKRSQTRKLCAKISSNQIAVPKNMYCLKFQAQPLAQLLNRYVDCGGLFIHGDLSRGTAGKGSAKDNKSNAGGRVSLHWLQVALGYKCGCWPKRASIKQSWGGLQVRSRNEINQTLTVLINTDGSGSRCRARLVSSDCPECGSLRAVSVQRHGRVL